MSTQDTSRIIREERQKRAERGEPLHDETRSLFPKGGSIGVTLTAYGRDTLDLSPDQNVVIEVYPDGIWIGKEGDGNE